MKKCSFPDLFSNYAEIILHKNKDAKILDFGSGSGRMVAFLLENGFVNVEAADIDEKALRDIEQKHHVKTHLLKDASAFLESVSKMYDVIIAKDVLYYFSAKELIPVLKNFNNALKKGGVFIAEIFNGSTCAGPYIKYKDIGIQLILTEHSLRHALSQAGFELKTMKGDKFPIKGVKSFLFSNLQIFWRLRLRAMYFFERGIDDQNPKILTRKIIAVAKANS